MAVSAATGLARSTINREIREVLSNRNEVVERVRRPGAGRKTAVTHQPGLPAALETLIEDAIRGDPCAAALGQPQPAPSGQSAGGAGVQGKPACCGEPVARYKIQLPEPTARRARGQSPGPRCAVPAYQCDGEGSDCRGRTGDLGGYKEEGTGWWKHRGKRSSREPPNDAANSSRAQSGESAGPSPRQCIDSLKTHVLSFVPPQLRQTSQGTEVENTVPDAITRIQDVFFAV